MDKRLAGKWYSEEENEIINVFDENPHRMLMSFMTSGYYNCVPNCVYEKEGYLCYEINDEVYRRVYHIRFASGFLEGYYTQHVKESLIRYKKVSASPEEGEFQYKPVKMLVPGSNETRASLLKKYASYGHKADNETIPYEFKLFESIPDILHQYPYNHYVSEFGQLEDTIAFRLLDFVCDHFHHDGSIGISQGRKVEDIIRFCEEHEQKTNCRGLAILLASLLRMNGIKASHITCFPYEEPFEDCHVVVDCLLPSGQRVMFDPSFRLYLKFREGGYVSLQQLRMAFIEKIEVEYNATASHNEEPFDIDYYLEYMTKNTFRFSRSVLNCDGSDEQLRTELIPLDYPIDNFGEYRKKEFVYIEDVFWNCFNS